MKPEAKLEAKIVRTYSGAVCGCWPFFGYAQDAGGHWSLTVLSGVGGVCLGLGLWFSTFVAQWPAVRQFIDAERVRQRSLELDAQVPK